MRRAALLLALLSGVWTTPLAARDAVEASAPSDLAVTLYRDPNRGTYDAMNRDWPQGFAMIGETRVIYCSLVVIQVSSAGCVGGDSMAFARDASRMAVR